MTSGGNNYDFDSFAIVANITDTGSNVYASTARYNYGPLWFQILHILFQISSKNLIVFRFLLIGLLSLVDLGIFLILLNKFGKIPAFFYLLNPITIIITGYHNQFDNFALLAGMVSVLLIGDNFNTPINKRKFLGLFILGLSLILKHILFVFPIWLAVKQKGIFQKLIVALVPILIFLCGFIPYWKDGSQGIFNNVFLYKSFNNEYFWRLFVPGMIKHVFSSTTIWIILLIFFAVVFRQKNGFDSLLLYTCLLVATAPATTNQYLAIVMPFIAVNLNLFTLCYTLAGSFYLLMDAAELSIDTLRNLIRTPDIQSIFYPLLVTLLCLGLIYSVWSKQLLSLLSKAIYEVKIQLGHEE